VIAQWHRDRRAARPKIATLASNQQLREFVQHRLAGQIRAPDGQLVCRPAGPEVERQEQGAPPGPALGTSSHEALDQEGGLKGSPQ